MAVNQANPRSPFLATYDPRLVRLVNIETGKYLHNSGQGEVDRESDFAWLGYRRQAQTLMDRAIAAGEDFPYVAQRRSTEEKAA